MRVFRCPINLKAVSIAPAVYLFCTADCSFCHIGVCVEWELSLFGWLLPGRFMRFFRCPKNPKAVSIVPAVFLFCTADRSTWCIRVCVEGKVFFSGLSSDGAGVGHLVLHREPFFLLTNGLRFLFRLKNSGHDAPLTIHPKPLKL